MSQKSGEMKIGHKGITFFCKHARKSASSVKILHLTITSFPFFNTSLPVSSPLFLSSLCTSLSIYSCSFLKNRQAVVSNHLSIQACLSRSAFPTKKIDKRVNVPACLFLYAYSNIKKETTYSYYSQSSPVNCE